MGSNYKEISNGNGTIVYLTQDRNDYVSIGKGGNDVMMRCGNKMVAFEKYKDLFDFASVTSRKNPLPVNFAEKVANTGATFKRCIHIRLDDLQRFAPIIFKDHFKETITVYYDGEWFSIIADASKDLENSEGNELDEDTIMDAFSKYFGVTVTDFHVRYSNDTVWIEYE